MGEQTAASLDFMRGSSQVGLPLFCMRSQVFTLEGHCYISMHKVHLMPSASGFWLEIYMPSWGVFQIRHIDLGSFALYKVS